MPFTQFFKSLAAVLKYYKIYYQESDFVLSKTATANCPELLKQDIIFTLKNIAYNISEAAICENLIYPLLKAAWKLYADELSIWSHASLEYDDQLTGIPDYLISKRSDLGKIIFDVPLLTVVEAKKDNFSAGWAQCAIEMVAMQKINNNPEIAIHGIVSNGEIWEVALLSKQQFTLYTNRLVIENLDYLFNVLISIFETCRNQIK